MEGSEEGKVEEEGGKGNTYPQKLFYLVPFCLAKWHPGRPHFLVEGPPSPTLTPASCWGQLPTIPSTAQAAFNWPELTFVPWSWKQSNNLSLLLCFAFFLVFVMCWASCRCFRCMISWNLPNSSISWVRYHPSLIGKGTESRALLNSLKSTGCWAGAGAQAAHLSHSQSENGSTAPPWTSLLPGFQGMCLPLSLCVLCMKQKVFLQKAVRLNTVKWRWMAK